MFHFLNAHAQSGESPLCFVMAFNAAECERWARQALLRKSLEDAEKSPKEAEKSRGFKVTDCDLKGRPRAAPIPSSPNTTADFDC